MSVCVCVFSVCVCVREREWACSFIHAAASIHPYTVVTNVGDQEEGRKQDDSICTVIHKKGRTMLLNRPAICRTFLVCSHGRFIKFVASSQTVHHYLTVDVFLVHISDQRLGLAWLLRAGPLR